MRAYIIRFPATGVLLALALAQGAIPAALAQAPATESHHASPATAIGATRYVPDAPLLAGMRRIKAAATELARPPEGGPDPTRVLAQADAIGQAVDGIFRDCRLAPEPDAALHPVLARLLGAVNALRADTRDAEAVAAIGQAIADYERLFGPVP